MDTTKIETRLRIIMRAANDLERATGVGGAVAETIQEQCNAIAREAGSDLRFGIGGAHEVTTNANVTGLAPAQENDK